MRRTYLMITGAAAVALLAGFSSGCSSSSSDPDGKTCSVNSDCGDKQYCGADKTCTSDCTQNTDCPGGGTCSSIGKCFGGTQIDGGIGPLADMRPVMDMPKIKLDTSVPQPDQYVYPQPDQYVYPQPDQYVYPQPDQYVPIQNPAYIGTLCEDDVDCLGDSICGKIYSDLPGSCTYLCNPDDPDTPLTNEDTCPNPAMCITHEEAGVSFCAKTCTPRLNANDCAAGIACDPMISALDFNLYDTFVCAFGGCTDDSGCQVITAETCNTSAPACTDAAAECLSVSSGSTDGLCVLPGKCNLPSGLCEAHSRGNAAANIGDPCLSDLDCAGNMTCFTESTSTDGSVLFRNGYCAIWGCGAGATLTTKACPTGSDCNDFYVAGICQKGCDLDNAASCRGNAADYYGDYECRGWNLPQFRTPITTIPVCDFPLFDCALLDSIGLTCDMLSNSTDVNNAMTCRGFDGVAKANPADPTGYCFDTTASGTQHR